MQKIKLRKNLQNKYMIKTQLTGRLGSDAEVKTLTSGDKIMVFNVAVDKSYKSKTGEKVEKTIWARCTKWNIGESTLPNYLKKGTLVYVEGEPGASAYTDKDGVAKSSLEIKINEIELLGKAAGAESATAAAPKTEESADLPF